MGISQNFTFLTRNQHLLISLLFIFSSIFYQEPIFAHGRTISNPSEALMKERVGVMMKRELIGSRPPRCEGKCGKCGNCEAIQVPIVPMQREGFPRSHFDFVPSIAYSRGDDLSNYKPMCWKCKCGDSIFNP